MNWKRINYILHRDIGFLCIGLTLLYAISGVVVNHISHSFNPSYKIEHTATKVNPVTEGTVMDMEVVNDILSQLKENRKFKNVVMMAPDQMRIFVEGNTIDVTLSTGEVQMEHLTKRFLLYELNYLHLNKPKKAWTYIADVYAVLLGFLAISGLFMIRKKTMRRGLVLTGIGFAIPIVYLLFIL
jgi:hypothetical protein